MILAHEIPSIIINYFDDIYNRVVEDAGARHNEKQYRTMCLENGMKVMLVHDDNVHESGDYRHRPACALAIDVGSLSNPSDLPGLAQFAGKMHTRVIKDNLTRFSFPLQST